MQSYFDIQVIQFLYLPTYGKYQNVKKKLETTQMNESCNPNAPRKAALRSTSYISIKDIYKVIFAFAITLCNHLQ